MDLLPDRSKAGILYPGIAAGFLRSHCQCKNHVYIKRGSIYYIKRFKQQFQFSKKDLKTFLNDSTASEVDAQPNWNWRVNHRFSK